jgi:hypothetical protein
MMNQPKKKKRATKHEGDIRDERDPKPIPSSKDVEEAEEAEDKEGNLTGRLMCRPFDVIPVPYLIIWNG